MLTGNSTRRALHDLGPVLGQEMERLYGFVNLVALDQEDLKSDPSFWNLRIVGSNPKSATCYLETVILLF